MKAVLILSLVMATTFAYPNYPGQVRFEAPPASVSQLENPAAVPIVQSASRPPVSGGYYAKEGQKSGPAPTYVPLIRGNLENDQQGKYNLDLGLYPLFHFRMTFPEFKPVTESSIPKKQAS